MPFGILIPALDVFVHIGPVFFYLMFKAVTAFVAQRQALLEGLLAALLPTVMQNKQSLYYTAQMIILMLLTERYFHFYNVHK